MDSYYTALRICNCLLFGLIVIDWYFIYLTTLPMVQLKKSLKTIGMRQWRVKSVNPEGAECWGVLKPFSFVQQLVNIWLGGYVLKGHSCKHSGVYRMVPRPDNTDLRPANTRTGKLKGSQQFFHSWPAGLNLRVSCLTLTMTQHRYDVHIQDVHFSEFPKRQ